MNKKFHIIKKSYLRIMAGGILIAGAWILFFMNMRFSVEFTGGMKMSINQNLKGQNVGEDLQDYLGDQGYENTHVSVKSSDVSSLSITTHVENDKKVAELSSTIQAFLIDNQYIQSTEDILELSITGPSVGAYMQGAATKALIIGIIFMAIYMMFAFSGIRNFVSPTILAVVTIITMIFDISIPAGAYGFWMMINPTLQIDTVFIIAILTTMGYSINDTIVIFDRIRENMQAQGANTKGIVYGNIFEKSLWQTMRRSIGTSLSTLLVIIAMYIFGTGVIQQFAFTMGIGVIAGTYSSIFLAAPLAYVVLGRFKKEQNKLT